MSDDARLEAVLAELAGAVAFPPTPSLAGPVAAAVRLEPARGSSWRWPLPLGRSLALAALSVLLVVTVVGAVGLGTGAIHIRFGEPSPLPSGVASGRGFGNEVGLDQARQQAGFEIRLPADAFPPPDHVFFAGIPTGGTVTLVWGDQPDYPTGADGIGLVVMEFRADVDPGVFEKMVDEGTRVQTVPIAGSTGWWVEGGDHYFFYVDADGKVVNSTLRLVGSVLFWEQDGLTFRIEGAPSLDAALAVARALSVR